MCLRAADSLAAGPFAGSGAGLRARGAEDVDDAVLRAIARWPDVPAAYGWLALDRRGDWHVKGDRITNPAVIDFIGRNHACDEDGRWFFQNGPQRVFLALAYTPFVLRTDPHGAPTLWTHTRAPATALTGAWLDEDGALLVGCNGSVGLVHDRDLDALLARLRDPAGRPLPDELVEAWLDGAPVSVRLQLEGGELAVDRIASAQVPSRFRFDPAPAPRPGEPEC